MIDGLRGRTRSFRRHRTVGVHEMAVCDTMSMVTCGEHVLTTARQGGGTALVARAWKEHDARDVVS